jgi:hypothetical protein
MANPIPDNMNIGAIGVLLVQLRLLECGVQSAPPCKDTGNDLIGVKGRCVKFIQVKTNSIRVKEQKTYVVLARA